MLSIARAEETASATVPPQDAPCKAHQKAVANFPVRLLRQGVMHGEALLTAKRPGL